MRRIPAIDNMTPEQILRKVPFRVPIPDMDAGVQQPIVSATAPILAPIDTLKYQNKSQADFVREFNPSSHAINSIKYYPNSIFKDLGGDGKLKAKIHTRVAVAYQKEIKTKRITALLGNEVGMRLITNRSRQAGEDALARFREGWEEYNMEIAIHKSIESDYTTGDCAVYLYKSDGEVGWRVFSYNAGDVLYPHYNPLTGEIELLGRLYFQEDDKGIKTQYLDVIDSKFYATYRLDLIADTKNGTPKWAMEMEPTPHGFPFCPVAYHRSVGPVWEASQPLIDTYEMQMSQFCEYNQAYGLGILFTCGAEFSIDTDVDGTPLHLDSVDPNAKAAFLNPAANGADTAFAKSLETLDKNIMRCSFIQHAPEIKSGTDISGVAVKVMNADAYYKALEDSQEYQLFVDRIVKMFRFAYGFVANLETAFRDFKIKAYLDPFYFMSESEVVNALVQLTAAGVLSRRSATEIAYNYGYGVADEWGRVQQQEHDELVAESMAQEATTTINTREQNPVAASRLNNA